MHPHLLNYPSLPIYSSLPLQNITATAILMRWMELNLHHFPDDAVHASHLLAQNICGGLG
jgi:hypothetical protein